MSTGYVTTVEVIPTCDFCSDDTPATHDGKTRQGPWAYMCEDHFRKQGVGVGFGRGQRLILATSTEEEVQLDALYAAESKARDIITASDAGVDFGMEGDTPVMLTVNELLSLVTKGVLT